MKYVCMYVLIGHFRFPFASVSKRVQGPVVRKPINANPGLKVKQAFNFSCIKVFFYADVL